MAEPQPTAVENNRLALFLDGTWNTGTDNTNVWRLKSLCWQNDRQLTYYDLGLGTGVGERFSGGIFGAGISDNVIEAYKWLVENYTPQSDIFIFGFSRGAYTARALSGLIAKCGLLRLGAPLSIRQLYNRYKLGSLPRTIRTLFEAAARGERDFSREEEWIMRYGMDTPIKFIGVWDTVGKIGSSAEFLNTGIRRQNEYAFHALAIDEHRKQFEPTLWTKTVTKGVPEIDPPPRKLSEVEQRWFVGAHANVGGGCDSDVLAQLPFKWIMDKAKLQGLEFRQEAELEGDPVSAPVSDSYREFAYGAYRFLPFARRFFRPIGVVPRDTETETEYSINETIDASVFERWRCDSAYRPLNLVQWAERYVIDIESITTSIRADARLTPLPG